MKNAIFIRKTEGGEKTYMGCSESSTCLHGIGLRRENLYNRFSFAKTRWPGIYRERNNGRKSRSNLGDEYR